MSAIVGWTVRLRPQANGEAPLRVAGDPREENPYSPHAGEAWVFGSRASAYWWCYERADWVGGDRRRYRVCALVRRRR
jgi:hypothetical protein